MTTSPPHTHISRRDLSALTAGIPYMIGFPPTNSVVLFTFTRGPALGMATTMRADLPAPEHVEAVTDHLVAAATLNEAVAVLAVVVGGTPEEHRPLVDALRKSCATNDILLVHASWVRTITHGERWRCYLDPQCTDEIPDPQTTTMAAARAIAGDRMYRDREDMAAHLAPEPPKTLARREELLDTHLRNPRNPYTEADLEADLSLVTNMLTEAEASPDLPVLTDRQAVRLARALSHPEVKDECMAAALTETPHAAERLWTVLIRALPAPERAEPAVLLAMSAYLRGAGVLAAMAIRTALDANPAHAMALLLDQALSYPVPPHHLRILLMRSILRNEGLPDDPPWDTTPPPPAAPKDPPRPDEQPDTANPPSPDNDEQSTPKNVSGVDGRHGAGESGAGGEPDHSERSMDEPFNAAGPLGMGNPPGAAGPPGTAESLRADERSRSEESFGVNDLSGADGLPGTERSFRADDLSRADERSRSEESPDVNDPLVTDGSPRFDDAPGVNEPSATHESSRADETARTDDPLHADDSSGVNEQSGDLRTGELTAPPFPEAATDFGALPPVIPSQAPGALNARTAATLGLLAPARPTRLNPLTEFLPPWPGGDGD